MWNIKMKIIHKFMTVFIFAFLFSLSLASAVTWRHNGTDMMRLDDEGNLTVSGNVTADYFIGDGSQLSNLPAGSLGTSINTTEIEDGTITDADINDSTNLTLGQKITFALGEIVDNIVDGWIRITGSLNVTENVTADYFIGNGSQLTGISPSLSPDSVNGTHIVDNVGLRNTKVTGNLNVTQNVTIGSMVVYEESGEVIFEY